MPALNQHLHCVLSLICTHNGADLVVGQCLNEDGLIANDRRGNPNWPTQKIIKTEINKPARTCCLKQLIGLVGVARRNTTGSRDTNDSLRVRFFSFHLSALLHISSESQTGSLIMSYNSKTVARISGGLHPSRFKTSNGSGAEES